MRKLLLNYALPLLLLAGCAPMSSSKRLPETIRHWAACYHCDLPAETFEGLDLVVFDGRYHPDITPLRNTVVLGYVTMGETYDDAPEKGELEASNALLFHNKTWNSHAVDLSNPQWQAMVMASVDAVMAKGFDGVFLDTVDSPLAWAKAQNPKRYTEMKAAAVGLIHAIRLKYPDKKIMLNRGFDIAARVKFDINYILAESILTKKDDFTGQFQLLSSKAYQDAVGQLHTIIARAEKQVQVLTLDYWNMDDREGVERIYTMQRASGFIPYVTTPDLKSFTPEPIMRNPRVAGT